MKQRITVEQLNKLTAEQTERLRDWWKPADGDLFTWKWHQQFEGGKIVEEIGIFIEGEIRSCHEPDENSLPLLSIGQMIHFIQDNKPLLKGISKNRFNQWFVNIENGMLGYKDELCDALWETVKQLLKG